MDQHARRLNRGLSLVALADAISARIAATRRRLVAGGLLQPVEWGVPGPHIRGNLYGRRSITYTMIDAYIQSSPALDYGRLSTERVDDILLIILEPLAITDEHTFRFGDPPVIYSVKKIDGLLQDEDTGVRYSSEVILIR